MSKHPVAPGKRVAFRADEPNDKLAPLADPSPWFSFRYSYTEISSSGGKAKVKRRETRFEHGTLKSETMDGTFDAQAFDAMARILRQQFVRQSQILLSPFLWLLPRAEHVDDDETR